MHVLQPLIVYWADVLSDIQAELESFRTAFDDISTRQYARDHLDFLSNITTVDYTL
jgi:hypothetical protein